MLGLNCFNGKFSPKNKSHWFNQWLFHHWCMSGQWVTWVKSDDGAPVCQMRWQTFTSNYATRETDVNDAHDQSDYQFSITFFFSCNAIFPGIDYIENVESRLACYSLSCHPRITYMTTELSDLFKKTIKEICIKCRTTAEHIFIACQFVAYICKLV